MVKEKIKNYSRPIKYLFFLVGIIATFAYRVIIVLNFYSPYWVKVAWYIGTIGFMFYFGYRFEIQRRESSLVADYDLIKVIKNLKIEKKSKKALNHVVKIVSSSKAKWNSLFISLLSLVALVIGIVLDLGWIGFG